MVLCLAFSAQAFGELAYERLSQFQPPAFQAREFTLGNDGFAYAVLSGTSNDRAHRIVRVDADGRVETVILFGAHSFSSVAPWLVKGPDGMLYGSATELAAPQRRVIYRLIPEGGLVILGTGNFILAPVFGGDGALYGCSELPGISRFRLTGEFETVPGTEPLRPTVGPLINLVSRVGGEIFFAVSDALWKIDANGTASVHVPFDSASPVAATIGTNLHGTLVRGFSQVIYGMTRAGGPENRGSIFKISVAGKVEPVVSFGSMPGRLDGTSTSLNIAEGGPGNLFHVSTHHAQGRDVFAITSAGIAQKIGVIPPTNAEIDALVTGSDKEAYAFYNLGDTLRRRTVFKFSVSNGVEIAAQSPEPGSLDGEYIQGQPVIGPDGGVWAIGAAPIANAHYPHAVRLRPDQTLHEFPLIGPDVLPGRNPTDLEPLPDGSVAGIGELADSSKSTVFRAFPDGSVSYVGEVGKAAFAPVQFSDGSLVGTTIGDDNGTVYRIAPNGDRTVVKLVTNGVGVPGEYPEGQLVRAGDGAWYGLTRFGGDDNSGTIFKVTENFGVTSMHQFGLFGAQQARTPVGSFVDGGDGFLYAASISGGKHGAGGLFRFKPEGGVMLVASFTEPISAVVPGTLQSSSPQLVRGGDGWFYGVTSYRAPFVVGGQGLPGYGFVFRVNKSGSFQVLARFTGPGGALPGEKPGPPLTAGSDGAFYGVTEFGGSSNNGTIFRVLPSGEVQHLLSFTGTAGAQPGANPRASLVRRGNVFYGVCAKGGANDGGLVFRLDQNNRMAVVQALTGVNGLAPGGAAHELVLSEDGQLYGTGGNNGFTSDTVSKTIIHGTFFRMKFGESAAVQDDIVELPVTHANVLANDGFDFTVNPVKVASVTQASHGRVTLNSDGTVSYKPDSTFTGTDTFTYSIKQGTAGLATATVTVVDSLPPKITRLLLPLELNAGDDGTVPLPDYANNTDVEDPSGPVARTQTPAAGTPLGVGSHDLTLTFTDVAGNRATLVRQVIVSDRTPPVIVNKPADRTIVRGLGEPAPVCPDLASEVTATDNVRIFEITQTPAAGTALPNGYTRLKIRVSDGPNEVFHEVSIRVIPSSESIASTGDVAPGFEEEEHRYVSFGSPAIAANGTLAYKATVRSASGVTKTAIFRREPGASPTLVVVTGKASQGGDVFTVFGEPLVNSSGRVVCQTKIRVVTGRQYESILSSDPGATPNLLYGTGYVLPIAFSTDVFCDFKNVSLLESGALLVHATVGEKTNRPSGHTLWHVMNGSWQLLLRTGESLTINGKASAISDLGFGKVLPRVGAQTRSFNAAGQLALRLTLADKRSAIVRVSVSGEEVLVEPVVTAGSAEDEWRSVGIPATNDAGDIAFRGAYKVDSGNDNVIGYVAAGQATVRFIATEEKTLKLQDPIVLPTGDVAIPARSKTGNALGIWRQVAPPGLNLRWATSDVTNQAGPKRLQHFDSLAVSDVGVLANGRYRSIRGVAFTRGIIQTDTANAILQSEGDEPPVQADNAEIIKRIDFLTPALGVGGQTRSVNASGQVAFRAKLSSGKTAIYVIGE